MIWNAISRLGRLLDAGQYPLTLVIRWFTAYAIASMLIDIPQPPIVTNAADYPKANLALVMLLLFSLSKPAAKWYKQQYWSNSATDGVYES